MTLVPTEFLDAFTEDQRQLINDLSRSIKIGLSPTKEDCPNCYYDGMAGSSAAIHTSFVGSITVFAGTADERTYTAVPFNNICPICRGKGYLVSSNEKTLSAHVWWYSNDKVGQSYPDSPVGYSGQNVVKIKSHSDNYSDFKNALYFVIDGVTVLPSSTPVLRGMGTSEGIVEIFCKTSDSSKDVKK